MKERLVQGLCNRLFQLLARTLPGAETIRIMLHRARGVRIGQRVWIGYDVILETSYPYLITIEDGVSISIRATIIAHFRGGPHGVKLERDTFIGPGSIILPGVVIGYGSVVTAGSVVNESVPPMTMVRGNPAVPVARCGIPLARGVSPKEFSRSVKPLEKQ